jgi:hypothetical protein
MSVYNYFTDDNIEEADVNEFSAFEARVMFFL